MEEATRLDEFYTTTTQDFNSGKSGFFARQENKAIVVDEFTPAELISDMVHRVTFPPRFIPLFKIGYDSRNQF
ncbi:MAG: hypothetical protein FWH32_04855 [Clostridiales bacterium]|nr:hypothetical protein [Clostridiales bacterium]